MTDDLINDLVSGAAKAQDADFGSPAIHAALKAATEDRVHMPDTPNDDPPDAGGAPSDRPYITPGHQPIPRFRRRLLAAAAMVAFAATCAAGVVLSRDDDTPRELEKTTTTTVPDGTIEERIIAAHRAAYAENIQHGVFTYPNKGQTIESWRDDRTGAYRSRTTGLGDGSLQGKTSRDRGPATFDGASTTGTREVDHCFSEYADTSDPAQTPPNVMVEELEQDLELGRLVVEGTEVRDGRDAIRLSYGPPEPRTGSIWLDATTLLPFRAEGTEDSDGAFVETIELLPRSPANLDLLVPPVPEGFTKVDQLRDQGENVAAGCETFVP